ncbi:MAG: PASTA domain-containing protein [Actinomycetota bacterium]
MARSIASDLAGRILAGRYVLQQAIGAGASGRVYAADDTRLRRRVAVKLLHAGLADDSAFLRRFRAEAQVAASLHHPHIMTVHDWGEDDVPFMVLELLEGGSLRSMLDDGTTLTVPQTARIGRDVASALEYAHARGILHRDVKPANLLFDEHGTVRVGDFGLARALAEASWTEPTGAVFGTARYASPEQALGVQLDGRSDLYSLALVLVEAVTATVPFAADTTIGMLTARTLRPITAPDELGALGVVVERAGRVEVSERYPNAATMRAALADVGESLPPPMPLTLAGMVDGADPHPTRAQPRDTATTAPTDPTVLLPAALFDQDAIEIIPDVVAPRAPRRLVPFVVAAVLVATVALSAAALGRVGASSVEVPGLVGRAVDDARARADAAGLAFDVVEERAAPDAAGTIIDQDPTAGSFTRGDGIDVVVSTGPANVEVPDLIGVPIAEADAALNAAGLVVAPREEFHDTVPLDHVIALEPSPGTEIAPDSTVVVVKSKGHAPVPVPDVARATFADAHTTLTAGGFQVQQGEAFSNTVDAGRVVETIPAIGAEAQFGSVIQVVVSKGPDLVVVPDLEGMTAEEAVAELDAVGLDNEVRGFRPGRVVRIQDPDPGTQIVRGSTVVLVLSDGNDD